jgi:hypothetical protein
VKRRYTQTVTITFTTARASDFTLNCFVWVANISFKGKIMPLSSTNSAKHQLSNKILNRTSKSVVHITNWKMFSWLPSILSKIMEIQPRPCTGIVEFLQHCKRNPTRKHVILVVYLHFNLDSTRKAIILQHSTVCSFSTYCDKSNKLYATLSGNSPTFRRDLSLCKSELLLTVFRTDCFLPCFSTLKM